MSEGSVPGTRTVWLRENARPGEVVEATAVALSAGQGWEGRVGLHSLNQAEQFYEHCGMTRIGPDAEYGRLVYYEVVPEVAVRWLDRLGPETENPRDA